MLQRSSKTEERFELKAAIIRNIIEDELKRQAGKWAASQRRETDHDGSDSSQGRSGRQRKAVFQSTAPQKNSHNATSA